VTSEVGWLRAAADGAVLRVHVVPGAALRVRVTARPPAGAANRELLRLLARALGLRPGDLELEAGAHGREKRVRVRGLPAAAVRERLAAVR